MKRKKKRNRWIKCEIHENSIFLLLLSLVHYASTIVQFLQVCLVQHMQHMCNTWCLCIADNCWTETTRQNYFQIKTSEKDSIISWMLLCNHKPISSMPAILIVLWTNAKNAGNRINSACGTQKASIRNANGSK